ncbi:MAG: PEP-CTERM sorting domain-containing protein [Phycisphaerae bacterium]|jgi:hypothetical protein
MKKKLTVFFLMACLMAGTAFGVENYWTGAAGDGDWMTAGNWGNGTTTPVGTLPGTTTDRANINVAGAIVNISASSSASAQQLDVAYSKNPITLNVYGELDVVVNFRVGGQTALSNGFMNVDGGTVTANYTGGIAATTGVCYVGRAGLGTLTITNGGFVDIHNALWTSGPTATESAGYGNIFLVDGTLHANGWRAYNATSTTGVDAARGARDRFQMDITGGKLLLNNDRLTQMYDFANSGILTGYGEAGYGVGHNLQIRLVEAYDPFDGTFKTMTEVTAIPEPATIMLLSMGSLILVRRKK